MGRGEVRERGDEGEQRAPAQGLLAENPFYHPGWKKKRQRDLPLGPQFGGKGVTLRLLTPKLAFSLL